jgi:peptidoglycan/xylan/chitin deacetylase (PgdA/CDA1 family)
MNMKSPAMRKLAFQALRLTLLPFVLREIYQRKQVTILVYHAPSPQVFDTHLDFLKRIYNIVPLSVYVEARRKGSLSQLPPRALIITLDDGHRSNYALKNVLEKHKVPVTIFLCSGLIDTRRRFWFLHENTTAIVQQLKTVPDEERLEALRRVSFEETKEFAARQALAGSELRELNHQADFQSHTVFHPILPRCSAAKAEVEITTSKLELQARLGKEVYALAYPNGDYSKRELQLAEKAGYTCALTLDRGFNTAKTPLFRLRRICIPDDADQHELLVKTSGLWGSIRAILGRRL